MKCRIDTDLQEYSRQAKMLESELILCNEFSGLPATDNLTATISQDSPYSDFIRIKFCLAMERGVIESELLVERTSDLKTHFMDRILAAFADFQFHNQSHIFHLNDMSENDLFNQMATTPKDFSSRTKTVLLVDDDPIATATLKTLIQSYGANVLSVGTTQEAEMVLSRTQNKIDLMILDWYLPRETGIDFLQRIDTGMISDRSEESNSANFTPVIMCSSRDPQYFSMPKLRKFCIKSYWFKGESFSSICSEIEKALQ